MFEAVFEASQIIRIKEKLTLSIGNKERQELRPIGVSKTFSRLPIIEADKIRGNEVFKSAEVIRPTRTI